MVIVNNYTVGIVTIIGEEGRAVHDWLKTLDGYARTVEPSGQIFHQATIDVEERRFTIFATRALEQNSTSATLALKRLEKRCEPTFNVLLGIAGGIHRDVQLGDVVIANQIINYAPAAETEEGLIHRGHSFALPAQVSYVLNDYFEQGEPLEMPAHREAICLLYTSPSPRD